MSDQTVVYNLPIDVLEKLICSLCNGYLSCSPVKARPDGAFICGRCSTSNEEDCIHQVLFETVIAKFAFPCRYVPQGCQKRLLFNHGVEHEYDCPHRTVCCPSLPHESCLKEVSVFDIYNHFKEVHLDLVLEDKKFRLVLEEDAQCNLLATEEDAAVIIQYLYDSVEKILHLDVRHFTRDDNKVVNFKLQMISGCDSSRTVSVKEQQCNRYESHTINLQSAETLRIENYLPALENPNFVYIRVKLAVSAKVSLENQSGDNSSVVITNLDTETDEEAIVTILNELEDIRCTLCHLFVFPPVYYTSRTNCCICFKCKEQQRRNAYEKIVEVPNYPCRWWGCTFIGNHQNIENHVENCQFRTFICPVSTVCDEGFYTRNNFIEHMKLHGTYCPNPRKIVIKLFGDDDLECKKYVYFTVFENRVIRFTCSLSTADEWRLTGDTENLYVEMYFQHDHCRFKSKTFKQSCSIDTSYVGNVKYFPECFKHCRRLSAVLKITKEC